jgi:hypothetical protein
MSVNLAYKTAAQSITSTAAALTFGDTLTNDSFAFELSPNNTRATVRSEYNGRYGKINAQYAVNFTYNEIDIRKNGASFPGAGRLLGYSAGVNAECVNSAPVLLTTNDYFEAFLRNISTTADTTDNELNWLQLEILPVNFRGALVTKTAIQTLSSGVATALSWDNEVYDLDSFHDNAVNNTRLTVPTGASLVRISQGVHRSNASSSDLSITAYKNGVAGTSGFYNTDTSGNSSIAHYIVGASAPLAVSPGDYFEAYCTSSVASSIIQNSDYTWFSMEVLPSNLKYAIVAKTTNTSIPSTTNTIATFNSEVVDVGGWFDSGTSNERLVVPAGVKRVRVTANVGRASASGQCIGFIYKNGALVAGLGRRENDTSGVDYLNIQTGVIPVSPGDYFDLRVWFNAASNLLGNGTTWFSIEEVPDDPHSILPTGGASAGGTAVTISGDGFLDATGVLFDTDPATSFVVVDNLTITCVAPAHADGLVDVTIQRPSGDTVMPSAFSFSSLPLPEFLSVVPDHGPLAGGTSVTLYGTGLSSVTNVSIGGNNVTSLDVVDDDHITFNTPAGLEGFQDIYLESPAGNVTVEDGWRYLSVARVSQYPIFVASANPGKLRISQLPLLVASKPSQPTRISQLPIMVAFPLDATPVSPMIPQWPIEETWEWLTTISLSRAGYEQRMGLRNDPRVITNISIPLTDQDMRIKAFYTLYKYIGSQIEYPLFQYSTRVLIPANGGTQWIDVDVSATNLRVGEAVYFFDHDGLVWIKARVEAISDSPMGVWLDKPLVADVLEGYFIAPAPRCTIEEGSSFSTDSVDNGSLDLSLPVVEARALLRPDQVSTVALYDNLPILPDKWVSSSDVNESFRRGVTILEGVSNREDFKSWYFPQKTTPRHFFVEKEDLDYWRSWFNTISGRRVPFLMPSLKNDLRLSVTPDLGATTLVTGDTQIGEYMRSQAIRWIMIRRKDGSVIYRKVMKAFINLDQTVSLQLDTSIGASAGNNQFDMISLISLTRLASDRVAITHSANYVEIKFSTQTVEQ